MIDSKGMPAYNLGQFYKYDNLIGNNRLLIIGFTRE